MFFFSHDKIRGFVFNESIKYIKSYSDKIYKKKQ